MKMTQELFERYLKGKCTPEEIAFVEEYIEKNDIEQFLCQEDWDNASVKNVSIVDYKLLDKIYERIAARNKKKVAFLWKYGGIAASILLAAFLISKLSSISKHSHQQQITTLTNSIDTPLSAYLVHINSSNQNMELKCSDGSIITLYPNSEVRYLETFAYASERTISLKGTAKFQVVKNKLKPFKVKSDNFLTTALGTTFIVSESNQETKIELLEGKIEVKSLKENNPRAIKQEINLSGTLVINNTNSRIINAVKTSDYHANREAYFVEKDDKITFKNLSINDIIDLLEQNYHVKIQSDPAKNRNKYFSGTFKNDEDVYKKVIQEINYLHKVNITYIQ